MHTDLLPIALEATPPGVPILVVDTPPEIAASLSDFAASACDDAAGVKVWDAWIESFPRRAPEPIRAAGRDHLHLRHDRAAERRTPLSADRGADRWR